MNARWLVVDTGIYALFSSSDSSDSWMYYTAVSLSTCRTEAAEAGSEAPGRLGVTPSRTTGRGRYRNMGPYRNMGLSVSGRHGVGGEALYCRHHHHPIGDSSSSGEAERQHKQLPPQQQDLPAYSMPCGKQTHIPTPLPEFQNFQSDFFENKNSYS